MFEFRFKSLLSHEVQIEAEDFTLSSSVSAVTLNTNMNPVEEPGEYHTVFFSGAAEKRGGQDVRYEDLEEETHHGHKATGAHPL